MLKITQAMLPHLKQQIFVVPYSIKPMLKLKQDNYLKDTALNICWPQGNSEKQETSLIKTTSFMLVTTNAALEKLH